MQTIIVVLFSVATICAGAEWDTFQVTYEKQETKGGYYNMPWTVEEATKEKKWEKIDEDKELNSDVYSQHGDPKVMLLFDKKGNIAGIRMGFLKDEVKAKAEAGGYKFEFDYDNNSMYESGKYYGKDLWYATVLFVSPKTLAAGGRNPLKKGTDEVAEGIYWKPEGKWIEMNKDECKSSEDFTEANCYPGMGKHYFYKLSERTSCKEGKPYFNLYNEGRLIGFGLAGYGSFSKNPDTQTYYEDFPISAVKSIIPKGPECVEDYIRKYGLMLMHVYFVKDAAKITCPPSEWRSSHC